LLSHGDPVVEVARDRKKRIAVYSIRISSDTVNLKSCFPMKRFQTSIRWEDVIPTVPVESRDLHRCYTEGRPASAPEAYPFVAPRLVYIHEMIRTKLGQIVQVIVPELRTLFLSHTVTNLLRPSDRL